MLSLLSADFFSKKQLSETLSECQTVRWFWTDGPMVRTDALLVLIWVQTVCKGYQQMAKVITGKERVKHV